MSLGVRCRKEPSFGPPGCNLFVFHLPDAWPSEDFNLWPRPFFQKPQDWTDDDLLEYFAPQGISDVKLRVDEGFPSPPLPSLSFNVILKALYLLPALVVLPTVLGAALR